MPGTKRLLANADVEDDQGYPAKRSRNARTVAATAGGEVFQEAKQPADSGSLPNKLAAIRDVAFQPNRIKARKELGNLRSTDRNTRALIDETAESWDALQRNPGVESRYIALCHDVVSGVSVKDAIRQNGPLPKEDKLKPGEVNNALQYGGPPELAPLAEEFSGRGSAIDMTFLTGVAYRMASTTTLCRASLEEAATFAKAFTSHTDKEFIVPLMMLGSVLRSGGPSALPEANIAQVAKLAEAFGTKDGANYANRHTPRRWKEISRCTSIRTMLLTNGHLKNICRGAEPTVCAFLAELRRVTLGRGRATNATLRGRGLSDRAISHGWWSRPMSRSSGVAGILRITKLGQLSIGIVSLIAISSDARAASYAETLFKEKFEVHIRQMVAEGIRRQDANYIAYAALARGSYEMCGDHLFPKSMVHGSYEQSLEDTSLPRGVVDRHLHAFERIMQTAFPDRRAVMRYCSSKP